MEIVRLMLKVWHWLNQHGVISGLFVTILGVWVAFWLAGIGERNARKRTTEQRLHLAVLECQYNGRIANDIIHTYAETNAVLITVKRPDSTAATAAFQDPNVLSFLPHHKVSLLRSYVNAITTLNEALQIHLGVLGSSGYKRTQAEANARENVRSNAASVVAMAFVLQEELKEYFDEKQYHHDEIKKIEDRVKLVNEKALKGEVSSEKEE